MLSYILHYFFILCLFFSPFTQARNPKNTFPRRKLDSHSWHEFERLRGASMGSHINGISQLKRYFNRFGYLKPEEKGLDNFSNPLSNVFDSNLDLAVRTFQQKRSLPVSGKLDSLTLYHIALPRCGVSDAPIAESESLHESHKFVYFTGRPRWARGLPATLTYALSPEDSIASPSLFDLKSAFKRAFSTWASVVPIAFVETDDYPFADIKIGFYYGDHGDGEAFDGVLGILAHAFSPESGRLHLDAAEKWAVDFGREKSGVAVDLESVAVHEIGHLLGLAHSDVKEAVMYPSLRPRERKVELKMDDVEGVRALYGLNPNFSLKGFSESYVSSDGGGLDLRAGGGAVVRVVGFVITAVAVVLCM